MNPDAAAAEADPQSGQEINQEMDPSEPDHDKLIEAIKNKLFSNAMSGNWDKVVEIYKAHKLARQVKITKSEDTAIHVAVADNQEDIVEKLVSCVTSTDLEIQNVLGNTPLHLAAILGSVRMCNCIAKKNRNLIGKVLNRDTETPFFLAVLHGKKGAFLSLHNLCKNEERRRYCRKKYDGNTILHAAIAGEYFDIAFEIIRHYEFLIDGVNELGFTPLHLLATKSTAFKSGSHISGFKKLIYHCEYLLQFGQPEVMKRGSYAIFQHLFFDKGIFVDELQNQSSHSPLLPDVEYDPKLAMYPETYHTCVALIRFLRSIVKILMGKSTPQLDAENPIDQPLNVTKPGDSSQGVEKLQADVVENHSDSEMERKSKILKAQGHQLFPENYRTCFDGLKLLSKIIMIFLGFGIVEIQKIREKKQKHIWSLQIMISMLKKASRSEYEATGRNPQFLPPRKDGETIPYALRESGDVDLISDSLLKLVDADHPQEPPVADDRTEARQKKQVDTNLGASGNCDDKWLDLLICHFGDRFKIEKKDRASETDKKETALLIAARNGVLEMVKMILDLFPEAIHDLNSEKKNVVLLAVENRQPHVYQYLVKEHKTKEVVFRRTDKYGNSALHLAALLRHDRPWRIPGSALQMQWEIKWFDFVKGSMPLHFFVQYNNEGLTPRQIFTEAHDPLVKAGGQWLTNTSQSCSMVAALIATVAFATSATVPGGIDQHKGTPTLESQPAFSVFAISSLVALCFSVTSLVMFLSILTSRLQEKDFGRGLPRKLLIGMSSLFMSIASMLVSFCAGHFFVLKHKLQYVAFPVYAMTCLPVTFFAILQFPLYFDLVMTTFTKMPRRSYK